MLNTENLFNAWEQAEAQYEKVCAELDKAWNNFHIHAYDRQQALSEIAQLQTERRRMFEVKKTLEALFDNL